MKKLFIFSITAILCSCTLQEFDENINLNPNQPSTASGPMLLSNAMLSLPGITANPTAQFFGQYLSETEYVVQSRYPQENVSFYGWYTGPLMNLQTVIDNSTVPNEIAIAKILKAYYFWHITDRWGDVPYHEALKGGDELTPAYDTQEEIYRSLFALLDEAQSEIVLNIPVPNDIIYGSSSATQMQKWKKFANTLRALMALRLSEVDDITSIDARAEFNNAIADGAMTSNSDNFTFRHLNETAQQNYWYGQVVVGGRRWWTLTETLVDLMQPINDPRLAVYGDTTEVDEGPGADEYAGLPLGTDPSTEHALNYSLLGRALLNQDQPVHLVTYAQLLFARAEAAARNWNGESAEAFYEAAIENSILQWTGSTDDVAAYIAQTAVEFDPNEAIRQIATQRYIHLFLHGWEGWSEWRRTGFPQFVQPIQGNPVPLRQSYAADEAFNNTENYNAAVQRQFNGEDVISKNVWWDQ